MTRRMAALSLVAAVGRAQKKEAPKLLTDQFATATIRADLKTQATSLVIYGTNGLPAVTINVTGDIIFGDGITPTEAARQFAEALKKEWPKVFRCNP